MTTEKSTELFHHCKNSLSFHLWLLALPSLFSLPVPLPIPELCINGIRQYTVF